MFSNGELVGYFIARAIRAMLILAAIALGIGLFLGAGLMWLL